MCGVFGYIGDRNALQVCLKGLEQLEYRGYDSTGIAGLKKGKLALHKRAGKLSSLTQNLPFLELELAIAHTRWATHGKVNDQNAHPHSDKDSSIALVHNGIIENHDNLRDGLKKEGVTFSSETDTEVIANLILKYYKGNLVEAVNHTLPLLKGIFSFVLIHKNHPKEIIAAARECALSIAIDKKKTEAIISSDANCFFGLNLQVLFLNKNEIARVKRGEIEVFDNELKTINKYMEPIDNSREPASKGTFEHFMLKEIFEQPKLIRRALFRRINGEVTYPTLKDGVFFNLNKIRFDEIPDASDFFKDIEKIWILGCGTSANAGSIAALLLEDLVKIPASCEIASEARYRKPLLSPKTLVIAISQSGETADTLSALRETKKYGCKTLSICNVKNSSITRETDRYLLLHAEPEISVCSTKAFTSQLTLLILLTLYLGELKQTLTQSQIDLFLFEMKKIPNQIQEILNSSKEIEQLAQKYAQYKNFFFMGRRYMLPTCIEAALKLKEISYANANGYPAGELKHGPIALLDSNFPVISFCANEQTYEKILSNLAEVKARGAPTIAFIPANLQSAKEIVDDVYRLPPTIDELAPFSSTVVGQLFAYYIAKQKGCDIDQPRNLAKSVTVE